MIKCKTIIWISAFIAMTVIGFAQEFPIAVGTDNTFGSGAAFDGTNFLFAITGDASNQYTITLQFVSTSGTLVGPRFSLGETGSSPMVAFDGSNYFVAWTDSFPSFGNGDTNGIGNLYGQFVSTSGSLVGSSFTLATGVNVKWGKGRGTITYQDTTYFLTYTKGPDHHTDILYGQRMSRAGNLIGSPIQISDTYAREVAVAFDGTNYLVAWCKIEHPNVDKDIYGQFVSPSGTLVGSNFLIDGSPYASDNPISMTFDGSQYWVAFHELAADTTGRWNLFARFVSTSGVVAGRFMICDSTKSPTYASAGFDGTNYLITWMEFAAPGRIAGRFFNASGVPIDTPFTVFGAIGGKFPIGGVGGFVDGKFLLAATRTDFGFTDGDVYGMFLPSSTTGVSEEELDQRPTEYVLEQNYPNPFNPSTIIQFSLANQAHVSLKVFDLLGKEVATLVDGIEPAGVKSVQFDGRALPSGVYFYRLQTSEFMATRRLVLVR